MTSIEKEYKHFIFFVLYLKLHANIDPVLSDIYKIVTLSSNLAITSNRKFTCLLGQ